MPDNNSLRHQLPYLMVAQAQKEITHNEALARIDALLHPVVTDRLATPPSPPLADAGNAGLSMSEERADGKIRQIRSQCGWAAAGVI